MTREELLAKIDEMNRILVFSNAPFEGMDKLYKALLSLRAVVELAITAVNGNPNTAYSMGYAAACERIIQAIEKELK